MKSFIINNKSLTALILACLLLLQSSLGCKDEFENCQLNRHCCGKLQCVPASNDDLTSDRNTCLSPASQELNMLSREKKLEMLVNFYANDVPKDKRKSAAEVEQMFERNGKEFAKLVTLLKRAFPVAGVERVAKSEL